jgi:hypothetical protein
MLDKSIYNDIYTLFDAIENNTLKKMMLPSNNNIFKVNDYRFVVSLDTVKVLKSIGIKQLDTQWNVFTISSIQNFMENYDWKVIISEKSKEAAEKRHYVRNRICLSAYQLNTDVNSGILPIGETYDECFPLSDMELATQKLKELKERNFHEITLSIIQLGD